MLIQQVTVFFRLSLGPKGNCDCFELVDGLYLYLQVICVKFVATPGTKKDEVLGYFLGLCKKGSYLT